MSGLQEGLKAGLAQWSFTPKEADEALADLLGAITANPDDAVQIVIAHELAHGRLKEARQIVSRAERAIKKAIPLSAEQIAKWRKENAAYQRQYYARKKAERVQAELVAMGE